MKMCHMSKNAVDFLRRIRSTADKPVARNTIQVIDDYDGKKLLAQNAGKGTGWLICSTRSGPPRSSPFNHARMACGATR